jgi:thiol:disulfide interchange protein DsbD
MDTFKRFMAFPMFATVIWLVWVLGQQTGIDGAASLLVLLMGLATVIWAMTLHGKARRLIASFSIALFLVTTWAIGKNIVHFSEPAGSVASTERWQAWAPGKVEQTLATGAPVFVNFTATWCVTCQYNKKNALANTDVLADLDTKKVVLLRADWTRRDPAITEALAALGRNGVPVYVFYTPGKAPVVLSEILSVSEVRTAIAGL